jgi:tetratricopeptide (TPR) repeat protein
VIQRIIERLRGRRPPPPDPIAMAEAEARRLPVWRQWSVWRRAFASTPTAPVAIRYARALAEGLRYDEAVTLLDGMIATADHPSLHRARIRIHERIGNLAEAHRLAAAYAASSRDPVDAAEAERLARDIGSPSTAPAAATGPVARKQAPAARAAASALIAANRHADAIAVLQAVARATAEPNDAVALMNATLLAGEVEAGTRLAFDGASAFPRDARFPRKLAQLAERDGELEAALLGYRAALSLDPASAVDRTGIARTLAMAGEIAAARDWLDDQEAGDLSFWTEPLRAFVAMRAGDTAAARQALGRAYVAGRDILAAYQDGRRENAADAFLLDDVHLDHPLQRFRASAGLFDGFVARLGAGPAVLVGNSPLLRGRGLGSTIDAQHTVIRLNDFRIRGFEADVGSRTDAWISSANRQAEPDPASVGSALAILVQGHALHVPELPAFARGRIKLDLEDDRACFLPPFLHRLGDALLYPVPTTGMRAILMLEFVVQQPFMAVGFDFFETAQMHYFDKGPTRHRVGESHAIAFERAFATEVLGEIGRFVRF